MADAAWTPLGRPTPGMRIRVLATTDDEQVEPGATWIDGYYQSESVGGLWWRPLDGGPVMLTPWRSIREVDVEEAEP